MLLLLLQLLAIVSLDEFFSDTVYPFLFLLMSSQEI